MRQVSFTLLITRHYDSNPAQYERNRRVGPVVLVLGRAASGAKLPSVGLRLKASKSESPLVNRSDTVRAPGALGGDARRGDLSDRSVFACVTLTGSRVDRRRSEVAVPVMPIYPRVTFSWFVERCDSLDSVRETVLPLLGR